MTDNNTTDKTRYSDEELQEFKQLILDKIEEARKNYDSLMSNIKAEENPTFKALEESAENTSREEAAARAQRQMEYIRKLQGALVRIENKTYGVCRITGKLIPKGRLMAVPHTTLSVEGKEIEQQRKQHRF